VGRESHLAEPLKLIAIPEIVQRTDRCLHRHWDSTGLFQFLGMDGDPIFHFHTHVLGVQVCHRVYTVRLIGFGCPSLIVRLIRRNNALLA